MHSDPIDSLFANITPDSPLAAEMEALLEEGLAVDPRELEHATNNLVARRRRPVRLWWALAGMSLLPAVALGYVAIQLVPSAPPSEAPGNALVSTLPSERTVAEDAGVQERINAAEHALRSGQYAAASLMFSQILDGGGLSEKELRRLALSVHMAANAAEGEERAVLMERAMHGYDTWLETYPDDPRAHSMHYAFGELLYQNEHYGEAYERYMTVATQFPESKHAAFCSESAVFAARKVIEAKKADGEWEGSESPGLNASETQLIAAVDAAISANPEGPKAAKIRYTGGIVLYESGEHAEARERFETLIELNPEGEEAVQAANLIADSYTRAEDWSALEEAALRFHEDEQLGDASFEAAMLDIAARAAMKQLEDSTQTPGDAADGWLTHLEQYGDVHGAKELAVDALRAAGRNGEADRLLE